MPSDVLCSEEFQHSPPIAVLPLWLRDRQNIQLSFIITLFLSSVKGDDVHSNFAVFSFLLTLLSLEYLVQDDIRSV